MVNKAEIEPSEIPSHFIGFKVILLYFPKYSCNTSFKIFVCGASGKEPTCQRRLDIRDAASIPGSGRSPGGEGMVTHFSILAWRIPVDRGAWWAAVHRVAQSWTQLKWLSVHAHSNYNLNHPGIGISWLPFPWRVIYSLIFCISSNFGFYPGSSECFAMVLWKTYVFCFRSSQFSFRF